MKLGGPKCVCCKDRYKSEDNSDKVIKRFLKKIKRKPENKIDQRKPGAVGVIFN